MLAIFCNYQAVCNFFQKIAEKTDIYPFSRIILMKPLGKARSKTDEPFDYLQKVIIIGDSGVGKSNLLLRYSEGKFVDNYMMTIGINYVFKVITLDGDRIKLQIWDTAGQDKYKTITQNYYRNSQGVLIVYSIDSRESFNSVKNWIDDLSQTSSPNTQVLIVGNKKDLGQKRQVSYEQAYEQAKSNNFRYFECSAKSGDQVEEVFMELAKMMKERNIDAPNRQVKQLQIDDPNNEPKRKCC